jgi:hypothetical protein
MAFQLGGLIGGIVATVVMTGSMMALGDDSPPPTAVLWAKFVGDQGPEAYLPQGMALHLLYGTGAGFVYGLLADGELLALGSPGALTGGVLNGLVYGLILMVGAVGWSRGVIGMDADPKQMGLMTFHHVLYGLILGAFVGLQLV